MSWSGMDPELVWGLIPRFVGMLYIVAFATLIPQHYLMPGGSSYWPISEVHARMRRDLPGIRRFFDFPSLLWLNSSDFTLQLMPWVGLVCGAIAVYGGPYAFYALILAWMLWLSLEYRGLIFPWDTMLQEVGFLILFVPTVDPLPSWHTSTLPLPSVAFMMRWFVIRLMWGFGKEKFIGANSKSDLLYLRGFMVWMPLPNPLGWLAHHLPAQALRAMYVFMFVAEVIAPFLGFFTGPVRVVSWVIMSSLMLGIHFSGNWGFFNIGYIMLSMCLLDTQASLFDLAHEPWVSHLTDWPDLAVHLLMAVMFPISILYVPNNSWLSRTWLHWPADIVQVPDSWIPNIKKVFAWLTPLRWIEPFRIVNGYGVFPPHALAPLRLVPVFEGSDDGVTWKQYGYKYMPTFPHSRPPIIAPYHARWDQYTYYITMGIDPSSMFGSLFPLANPYSSHMRVTMLDLFIQRLLRNDRTFLSKIGHNPFPDQPPKMIRVGVLGLTPTRISELRETGHWWHVQRFGTLYAAREKEEWTRNNWLPEPELFHYDNIRWRDRTLPLQQLVKAYRSGMPLDQAVIAHSDLTIAEVERFWSELVPLLNESRGDFTALHARADAVRARFDRQDLIRMERILERYAWLLRKRTEHHRFGQLQPSLPPMSNYRFHMLLHEVVLDGREACDAMLREPADIVERFARSTDATQLWAVAVVRYEQVMAHVTQFRGSEMGGQSQKEGMSGLFEYFDLVSKIVPRGEEFLPVVIRHPDGEHTIAGFYPPPRIGGGSLRETASEQT
jgi:hypothetical protein